MKAKLAMMKNIEYDFTTACEESLSEHDGYIQLTEFVEVDFPDLPPDITVRKQLEAIERQAEAECERHEWAMKALEDARGKLLALTHEPEVASGK